MPETKYISLIIGDAEIEASSLEDLPVSLNYSLEDNINSQVKTSSTALGITVPATIANSRQANTFYLPSIEDLTNGEVYKSFAKAGITASGYDLLIGKAILKSAIHRDKPISYTYDFYGDNADWVIDLKELTLYDILKHISFTLSKSHIESSWSFDGTDPAMPYVFAPVRYRAPFNGYRIDGDKSVALDDNIPPIYLRPALSKYWIIQWGFAKAGYRVISDFMNTEYYKRMVMPWSWGNFLSSEGTKLDIHRFRAKGDQSFFYDAPNGGHGDIWDLQVTNDHDQGMFDNNGNPGDYVYNVIQKAMQWTYNPPHYGTLEVTFSIDVYYRLSTSGNSDAVLKLQWYKNGVRIDSGWGAYDSDGNLIAEHHSSGVGGNTAGVATSFFTTIVNPGDVIQCKVHRRTFESKVGHSSAEAQVQQFQIDYFRIPLGGQVDFDNFNSLKKYKFLDFLTGEIDLYDLSLGTIPERKEVVIEPTHAYSLQHNQAMKSPGYFVDDIIDWTGKKDLSKDWVLSLYSDGERERIVSFKNDNNDGIAKVVQDRHTIKLGSGKYALPDRFKSGKASQENRFFGPTMHFDVDQFRELGAGVNTDVSPQMICMVPENISNTSNSESGNTFLPKSAYYKGLITGVGAWRWDGAVRQDYPYMFAVNYKSGGYNDPVLSYSDENIGGTRAVGLLRRFFLQRFAVMRNGQWYNIYARLNNYDFAGIHREHKELDGNKYELVSISNYLPLKSDSTKAFLRKTTPVQQQDIDALFPSDYSIQNGKPDSAQPFDEKYNPLKGLKTDIPL